MSDKKETFNPLHWDELTLEEQQEAEKILKGEPSKYDRDPKEEITIRINQKMKQLSDVILNDMQSMIDAINYNTAQLVILRKKTKEILHKAPKDLSYLVLEATKGRKN